MNNQYEYIQVDPKVIQMLGGSDDMDAMVGELGGDLPNEAVASYRKPAPVKKNMFEGLSDVPVTVMPSPDCTAGILQEILNELREIKVILAGRE